MRFSVFEITRCSPVWFLFLENRAVRCGAVFTFSKSYGCGAVRCDEDFLWTVTVRCGTEYIFQESYGTLRCGCPLNSCFLRCG